MAENDLILDHAGLLPMKRQHPEWIWNRSDSHVILGVPGSPETFKTIVEPGNSFSPGFSTYGVSSWVTVDGTLYAPELIEAEDVHWRYSDGYLPVLRSEWMAGPIRVSSYLFTDGDVESRRIQTHFAVVLENTAGAPLDATLHMVVRSFGAAGGPITSLEFDSRDVVVNGAVALSFDAIPDRARAVGAQDGLDISMVLRGSPAAVASTVNDPSSWASGSADFEFHLEGGASATRCATAFVHSGDPVLHWLHRERGMPFEDGDRAGLEARWRELLPISLDLPDARFSEAMLAQAASLAMSTSGLEPRISPISYPLWWLRDGSYVLVALEKAGFTEWTDRAIESVARREPFGGFGAEGDGASQLIWVLSEHYLISRDLGFLRDNFEHIERNADLLIRMRQTTVPIFGRTEIRTPEMMLHPQADLMAAPARDDLIEGRMDWHYPRFWINGWAYLGLMRAALCADALGLPSAAYRREATTILEGLNRIKDAEFGDDERDFISAYWPTGWAGINDGVLVERYERLWDTVRFPKGRHAPEREWTYFEVAQAHNLMLLGQRERAWVSIEHFLANHAAPGLYTYHEGIGDENSSLQWQRARGWDTIPHVTPHGWTSAELFLLLRDALIREMPDGGLAIGLGIPDWWLDSDFSVRGLPSHFGDVDVVYYAANREVSVMTDRDVTISSALTREVSVVHAVRTRPRIGADTR